MFSQLTALLGFETAPTKVQAKAGESPAEDFASVFARHEESPKETAQTLKPKQENTEDPEAVAESDAIATDGDLPESVRPSSDRVRSADADSDPAHTDDADYDSVLDIDQDRRTDDADTGRSDRDAHDTSEAIDTTVRDGRDPEDPKYTGVARSNMKDDDRPSQAGRMMSDGPVMRESGQENLKYLSTGRTANPDRIESSASLRWNETDRAGAVSFDPPLSDGRDRTVYQHTDSIRSADSDRRVSVDTDRVSHGDTDPTFTNDSDKPVGSRDGRVPPFVGEVANRVSPDVAAPPKPLAPGRAAAGSETANTLPQQTDIVSIRVPDPTEAHHGPDRVRLEMGSVFGPDASRNLQTGFPQVRPNMSAPMSVIAGEMTGRESVAIEAKHPPNSDAVLPRGSDALPVERSLLNGPPHAESIRQTDRASTTAERHLFRRDAARSDVRARAIVSQSGLEKPSPRNVADTQARSGVGMTSRKMTDSVAEMDARLIIRDSDRPSEAGLPLGNRAAQNPTRLSSGDTAVYWRTSQLPKQTAPENVLPIFRQAESVLAARQDLPLGSPGSLAVKSQLTASPEGFESATRMSAGANLSRDLPARGRLGTFATIQPRSAAPTESSIATANMQAVPNAETNGRSSTSKTNGANNVVPAPTSNRITFSLRTEPSSDGGLVSRASPEASVAPTELRQPSARALPQSETGVPTRPEPVSASRPVAPQADLGRPFAAPDREANQEVNIVLKGHGATSDWGDRQTQDHRGGVPERRTPTPKPVAAHGSQHSPDTVQDRFVVRHSDTPPLNKTRIGQVQPTYAISATTHAPATVEGGRPQGISPATQPETNVIAAEAEPNPKLTEKPVAKTELPQIGRTAPDPVIRQPEQPMDRKNVSKTGVAGVSSSQARSEPMHYAETRGARAEPAAVPPRQVIAARPVGPSPVGLRGERSSEFSYVSSPIAETQHSSSGPAAGLSRELITASAAGPRTAPVRSVGATPAADRTDDNTDWNRLETRSSRSPKVIDTARTMSDSRPVPRTPMESPETPRANDKTGAQSTRDTLPLISEDAGVHTQPITRNPTEGDVSPAQRTVTSKKHVMHDNSAPNTRLTRQERGMPSVDQTNPRIPIVAQDRKDTGTAPAVAHPLIASIVPENTRSDRMTRTRDREYRAEEPVKTSVTASARTGQSVAATPGWQTASAPVLTKNVSVTSPFLADLEDLPDRPDLPGSSGPVETRAHISGAAQSTSHTAMRPDTSHVLKQVAEVIPKIAEGRLELQLSPEELGRVRFHMTPGEHGFTVHVTADRPETLDLMRRNAEQLARDFAEAGYEDAGFTFGDDHGANPGSWTTQEGHESLTDSIEKQDPRRSHPETPVDDGLDIRI